MGIESQRDGERPFCKGVAFLTDALRGVFPMSFAGERVKTETATFLVSSPYLLPLLIPSLPPLLSALLVLLCHFGSSTPSLRQLTWRRLMIAVN